MATVNDILEFVEKLAPRYMKMNWDNCGLLCGRKDRPVKKILVALDPFRSVIEEAISIGADVIVTHHPLIFGEEVKAVNEDTETGRCLLALMENGIAAINAHTNLDQAPGGINDILAQTLGLENITVLTPQGEDAQGRPWGLLRAGDVPQQPLGAFLGVVKERLGCDGLRFACAGKPVRRVAVGGGSCGGAYAEAAAAGCDTLVTADVKYNQFRSACETGINLIDAGHFHTENPTMPVLAGLLREKFPDITVIFSEKHTDCMKFY